MGIIRKLQFAIRTALAAAAATAVVPTAWSQTVPAAANESPNAGLEEVVVTGPRITSPNLTAISPITSVDAGYISSTNLTRVKDILNNLPMVFAGQNSTVSNGATGTASVNLRGLGPNRTLVQVNGRRLGPGQGTGTNVSDINEVPAALIERVDILTGGASAAGRAPRQRMARAATFWLTDRLGKFSRTPSMARLARSVRSRPLTRITSDP